MYFDRLMQNSLRPRPIRPQWLRIRVLKMRMARQLKVIASKLVVVRFQFHSLLPQKVMKVSGFSKSFGQIWRIGVSQ